MKQITLYGRVFLTGKIEALTGLHIGKGAAAIAIGDLENPVVRNPLTEQPYIPGSSLKGKMRSLLEKAHGKEQNQTLWREEKTGREVKIHVCPEEHYLNCEVCPIFGVPGEKFSQPTRLIVRDIPLSDTSAEELSRAKTDLPYSEIKWEVAIDRVTSQATPRQMERVPAGAVFSDMELIYGIYKAQDIDRFENLLEAMQLVEDDYLGGLGSRGSGKVKFKELELWCKAKQDYSKEIKYSGEPFPSLKDLLQKKDDIKKWLKDNIPTEEVAG
ncbi:type III-A CRISPR-associated RAMP protein Csm3 [Dehalococcoidales bacterium]|nr:type III-A CRISPR-associated RAMP protein Csm3 [Dehalococcoidales bacterium]